MILCVDCGQPETECACGMPLDKSLSTLREDLKPDAGKLQYSLILEGFLEEIARVLTKGEANHPKIDGAPSWQLVEPVAYENALFRHLQEYRKDNNSLDEEMGTHHMAHVACNAMFLWWFSQQRENNERLKDVKLTPEEKGE